MPSVDIRQIIKEAVVYESVRRKSGGTCDYYIDGKRLVLNAAHLKYCGEQLLEIASQEHATHIGGEVASALPLVGAVLTLSARTRTPLQGFIVRESSKSHGISKLVEGYFPPDARLLVIDDVVGTGSVALRCCRLLREMNLDVRGFCAVIDRNEGAREKVEAEGFAFHALDTLDGAFQRWLAEGRGSRPDCDTA